MTLRLGITTSTRLPGLLVLVVLASAFAVPVAGQQLESPEKYSAQAPASRTETTENLNQRIHELEQQISRPGANSAGDYRLGAEDLLEVSIFEASELNHVVRVSAGGEISLPLLGSVHAAGLTPRELEFVLEELLRRTYMKDPHVAVFVKEMQSHPVSVFGAVKKPGVFQIRGAKTLVEVLSLAEGLADDAGDNVVIMRHAVPGPSQTASQATPAAQPTAISMSQPGKESQTEPPAGPASAGGNSVDVNLKSLLESGDPKYNVLVYPGDLVKVTRAGVVYVVGEVRKPGGFELKTNENISVVQALALAEGLTRTSAKSRAQIIRTDEITGQRQEIPLNLDKILGGKTSDPVLHAKDIVFVPNSNGRSALYKGAEAAISIAGGVIVYRR
ncbi:MAG: polysaccharide biosynthesis/export family protein [Acidobacteria bacterium]|nr:polysaccharide biosynthesis/export family protein [Acidobacteriota bacterium]